MSKLDGLFGRGVALFVAIAMGAGIWAVHEANRPKGADELTDAAASNPELAACLTERVGTVENMRRDGVISDAQFNQFRARAVAFCEGEFGR